jgi:DMSO/TMAO reductase YedYZ molybdopterin-dependent catalytic subunit
MPSENASQRKLPPGQRQISHILRWGVDHPSITADTPRTDLASYVLVIDGKVKNPVRLTWPQVMALQQSISISDFHCVEGWSVLDCKWEGVLFKEITKLVKPTESGKFVTFECADGYTTSLTLDELQGDDIILAAKLNGKELEQGLGFPLRLIVPSKYAYKSALWVIHIHFTSKKERGFWERRGYSDNADVWSNKRFSN